LRRTKPYNKHSEFIVQTEQPFNGNAPLSYLCQQFMTPTELFFARNHGTIPEVETEQYCLRVDGLVDTVSEFSLDAIQQDFEQVEVMAVLQCAGNRRDELAEIAPIPNELPWSAGAISNATWGGARLKDILAAAGVQTETQHVAFRGLDEVSRRGETFGFGGSIPIDKALHPDTLLAYTMNGAPLTQAHGFPVRVIVPGYIGARSVKWVSDIRLQEMPSENYFQAHAYKLFPPDVTPENVRWEEGVMLGENSLNSVICYPSDGDVLKAGLNRIAGYAIGGINPIEKVEVSGDGGVTWQDAKLMSSNAYPWAWWLWQAQVELKSGVTQIIARAQDSAGETQPSSAEGIWNFKGYANNAWHHVNVKCKG
jgi:sulfite oxidase